MHHCIVIVVIPPTELHPPQKKSHQCPSRRDPARQYRSTIATIPESQWSTWPLSYFVGVSILQGRKDLELLTNFVTGRMETVPILGRVDASKPKRVWRVSSSFPRPRLVLA